MTYQARQVAPFKVDFLRLGYSGTMVNNPIMELSGSLDNTRATLSNDEITLYSGSHWRIEFSNQLIRNASGVRDFLFKAQVYSVTDSQVLGTEGELSVVPQSSPSDTGYLTRGRCTACALVLNGDISTSKVIRLQIEGLASRLTALTASDWTRVQYGIVKIMELPA